MNTQLMKTLLVFTLLAATLPILQAERLNVLLVMSDDLTSTALPPYGNQICEAPNIARLATEGITYNKAYCQFPTCAPSRASLMSGLYPDKIQIKRNYDEVSVFRDSVGDIATFSQHFKNNGYHAARISKIYHMRVPNHIIFGEDGPDDPASWTETFNAQGPEWQALGNATLLSKNSNLNKEALSGFGGAMYKVEATGDDLEHSDGRAAAKAVEFLNQSHDDPFFLAVGFVRPHVPLVAPASDFGPYDAEKIVLPNKIPGDRDDIFATGIISTEKLGLSVPDQKKTIEAYYACISYMDRQLGKVLSALDETGLREKTIVIFTSDHGWHLGEHDFWEKQSLHEESAKIPLIISVPGEDPAVCESFVELIDLYPTISELCGLPIPSHVQGESFAATIENPSAKARDFAFSITAEGSLIRTGKWAYMKFQEGAELYDMKNDPQQVHNLSKKIEYKSVVTKMENLLEKKLQAVAD